MGWRELTHSWGCAHETNALEDRPDGRQARQTSQQALRGYTWTLLSEEKQEQKKFKSRSRTSTTTGSKRVADDRMWV
jgi:hypothetical protein